MEGRSRKCGIHGVLIIHCVPSMMYMTSELIYATPHDVNSNALAKEWHVLLCYAI